MNLRKYISLFVLLMMLATQGAVAHHLTVHTMEDAPHSQKHDNGHDAADLCDLCLLSKSMAHALDAHITTLAAPLNTETAFIPVIDQGFLSAFNASYAARAPPTAS